MSSSAITGNTSGIATASTPGLYKAGQAPGSTAGTAIAAGYIGELLFNQNTSVTATAAAGVRGLLTLTIPSAGVYSISTYYRLGYSGAPGVNSIILGTTGPTSAGFSQISPRLTSGYTDKEATSVGATASTGELPNIVVTFSGAATLYLNVYTQNSVSVSGGNCFISAVRIA